MRGLDDLVHSGKVLYIGVSDTPAWVVSRANMLAELRGWAQFVVLQIPYSLSSRDAERELFPMAKELGLAVTPWGLLEAGLLTGKYTDSPDAPKRLGNDVQISEREQRIIGTIKEVSKEIGRSKAQVAINWVRQQQFRSLIIPILGARSEDHLRDNLACLEWELNEEQIKRLDEASQIELGFPHGFLEGNRYVFGNTFELIDKPPR
jgi:aryl-alcohol dehydrogenase-like predicted oxidoreductase